MCPCVGSVRQHLHLYSAFTFVILFFFFLGFFCVHVFEAVIIVDAAA